MKQIFKKSIVIVLAALMLLTAAPLSGVDLSLSAQAAIDTADISIETDWIPNEQNRIAVKVFFTDAIDLRSWDFELTYDAELFEYHSLKLGEDAKAIDRYCESNSITNVIISNATGLIQYSGYFSQELWDAETFLANSNRSGDCIVNDEKFEAHVFYLTVIDEDAFKNSNTTILISGLLSFAEEKKEVACSTTKSGVSTGISGTCGDDLTWTLDDEGTLTISGKGNMYDYDSMDNCAPWYDYNVNIATVVMEDGITSIGDYAFSECAALTEINMPDSVISIGSDAFYDCGNLERVTIPNGVTSISYGAFSNCDSLESVTFGDNSKLASIGDYAFAFCHNLVNVKIPDSVKLIDECAFYSCMNLENVIFGDNSKLTSIHYGAFAECPNLANVTIPDSVTSIGEGVFMICPSLTAINIPNNVTHLGDFAFACCDSLESVTFGDNSKLTSIGSATFELCSSLNKIYIPNSVTSIGEGAFNECTELADVYYSGSEAEWDAITIDSGNDALLNATIHFEDNENVAFNPSFVLESDGVPGADGFITVDLYVENSVGLTSFNFYIDYDPAILSYASFDAGADAKALNKMNENNQLEFNNITFESNNTGMQLKLSGYFGTGLYSAEHFVTLDNNCTIDSARFHLASIHFAVEDITANAQIDATAIFDFEGFAADGFLYPAHGMIRNLTTLMDVSICCVHVGETEIRNAREVTCSVAGYTGDTYCLVCGEKIADGEPIATIPHTWNDGIVTIEPTCHTVGEKKYICSVCGQTKTEELAIDAANHDGATEIRNELAETCGTDGYTGDTYCLECNTVVLVGTVIPATGEHAWNNGVVTTEPTYTTFGVKTYTCTVCGNTRNESIEMLVAEFTDKAGQSVMDENGDIIAVAGTTVEQYLEQASEGTVIMDADGSILGESEHPGTGDILILPDGTEHTIVVLGDLHGDGEILANDARTALRNSVGLDALTDAQLKAADVTGDGVVSAADARLILRWSVGLEEF